MPTSRARRRIWALKDSATGDPGVLGDRSKRMIGFLNKLVGMCLIAVIAVKITSDAVIQVFNSGGIVERAVSILVIYVRPVGVCNWFYCVSN